MLVVQRPAEQGAYGKRERGGVGGFVAGGQEGAGLQRRRGQGWGLVPEGIYGWPDQEQKGSVDEVQGEPLFPRWKFHILA